MIYYAAIIIASYLCKYVPQVTSLKFIAMSGLVQIGYSYNALSYSYCIICY